MDMVGNWSSRGKGIRFVKDVCEVVKDRGDEGGCFKVVKGGGGVVLKEKKWGGPRLVCYIEQG